jgi:hypothetical protein
MAKKKNFFFLFNQHFHKKIHNKITFFLIKVIFINILSKIFNKKISIITFKFKSLF